MRADLVIDALVGYGLAGPPVGIAAAATELAVACKKPILALDVPTGVNAATGEVSSPAIRAMTTLTLDLPKRGVVEASARATSENSTLLTSESRSPCMSAWASRSAGCFPKGR